MLNSTHVSHIGVLTSGGDAPGMNAAIRAVVRTAVHYNKRISGIFRGYEGMIEGDIQQMDARSVGHIIQRGGTLLKSARCSDFLSPDGRAKAYQQLQHAGVDALIVIGGDGSFRGAAALTEEHHIPVVGIPGTIDNDLSGTDYTIGYDTACNTVVRAVDAIRDTASSHNRIFFVEAMGRDSGYIALRAGIAAGMETIIIPEQETEADELLNRLIHGQRVKKSAALVMVSEGCKAGGAMDLAEKFRKACPHLEIRVTILGHIQRGGPPGCLDREYASRMGVASVEGILTGQNAAMVGIQNQQITFTPFSLLQAKNKPIDTELLRIQKILSV